MTYTIKQISNILDVNSETIRRWVRTGELIGTISSRKNGYVIEEVNLIDFLDRHKKYYTMFRLFKLLPIIAVAKMKLMTDEDRNQAFEFMCNRLKEEGKS
jgi:transposase